MDMKDWKTFLSKCHNFVINTSLMFEFQICLVKLLAYNALLILLISNHDKGWCYAPIDLDNPNHFGGELIDPLILPKFGFSFRLLTVAMNTPILDIPLSIFVTTNTVGMFMLALQRVSRTGSSSTYA
uniref:Uncharacterized protein n=1 Tax=Glossina brevipalpis TaxID=37001 RepID=A0A1A9X0V4_9MUSC